jgi:hypothetical protein
MLVEKYKHKVVITCGLWHGFKDFRSRYKLIHPTIDRKKYVDLCHIINTRLSDKIIRESFEFRMPARLGTLSIKKTKLKIKVKDGRLEKNKMVIDWKKTWDYWYAQFPGKSRKEINAIESDKKIIIYNMNEHTNGYIMNWCWDKNTCVVRNQTVYYFKPTKRNRLELARWIKSDEKENDYYLMKRHFSRKIIRPNIKDDE